MKGCEIFLGDLIRVIHALHLSENKAAILRVGDTLGFAVGYRDPEEPQTTPFPRKQSVSEERLPEIPAPTLPLLAEPESPAPPESRSERPNKTPAALSPIRQETVNPPEPAWLEQETPFPQEEHARLAFAPRLEPLFGALQTRGIVSAALATRMLEGEIDEELLVDKQAMRVPFTALPRRSIASFRRGVQVILDRREAMMPFFPDQNRLAESLLGTVGRDQVAILQFLHHPLSVLGCSRKLETYRPPAAGTPVLLVSDISIGGPPLANDIVPVSEWLRFADVVKRARCPLVLLVPYPPERWPRTLSRALIIVQWDRRTTAGAVRRRVGLGLAALP